MFTGIIEEIGTMKRIAKQGQAMVLTIAARRITSDVHLGDSIAVNGVCLTVVAFDSASITVDVMPETFRRSTLKHLSVGAKVNLERAMAANSRFGGHIVQGHVDATGTVQSRQPEDNAVVFRIAPDDPSVLRYIVPKGSIAVDGISLTVVDVTESEFSVSIIPHTLAQTILQEKQPGHAVNLETDIIGKYVEKLLSGQLHQRAQGGEWLRRGTQEERPYEGGRRENRLTEQFLAEHGFR